MSNPWLKKNPFLSLWLSTANRMVGSIPAEHARVNRPCKPRDARRRPVTASSISSAKGAVTPPAPKKTRKQADLTGQRPDRSDAVTRLSRCRVGASGVRSVEAAERRSGSLPPGKNFMNHSASRPDQRPPWPVRCRSPFGRCRCPVRTTTLAPVGPTGAPFHRSALPHHVAQKSAYVTHPTPQATSSGFATCPTEREPPELPVDPDEGLIPPRIPRGP